jgi:hypothetical protein
VGKHVIGNRVDPVIVALAVGSDRKHHARDAGLASISSYKVYAAIGTQPVIQQKGTGLLSLLVGWRKTEIAE